MEASLGDRSQGDPYPEGWDNRYPPPFPLEVVGVVADMLSVDLTEAAPPTFYTLNPFAAFTIYVRVAGDPVAMLPGLRAAIEAVDPDIGLESAQPMSMAVCSATAETRFQAILLTLFAGLAVFMTGLGLFGVLAHAVSRRPHEMAVRVSLGARRREVSGMIVRDAVVLGAPGIARGLGLTFPDTLPVEPAVRRLAGGSPDVRGLDGAGASRNPRGELVAGGAGHGRATHGGASGRVAYGPARWRMAHSTPGSCCRRVARRADFIAPSHPAEGHPC